MARTLEQVDNAVAVIEALLDGSPVADEPEISFPIAERALNSTQWQAISLAAGSGIPDRGGRPFWLRNPDNGKNEMTLTVSETTGTAEAAILGFFYQMKSNQQVSLPYVSTRTTYHVGLEFDPARLKSPLGPIRRVVHTNTIPYTAGRIFLPLWEVIRNPNQLLSDAEVIQRRPKITPTITVDRWENRPPERAQLWGTRMILTHAHDRGREFIAWGASEETGGPTDWVPVNGLVWRDLSLSGGRSYAGHGEKPQYAVTPQGVLFRGRIARTSGNFTSTSDGWPLGWPSGLYEERPFSVFQPVGGQGTTAPTFGRVSNLDGTLHLWPRETMGWVDLGGLVGYWT